jgi:hypothetical protein
MWAIRILNGAQAGKIFPLKMGKNIIGRAPQCEVNFRAVGVSKEHAQIFITDDKIILSDLNSRNGTFVNGVKIQNQRIGLGDKVSLNDMIFDILKLPDIAMIAPQQTGVRSHSLQTQGPSNWGSAAPQMPPQFTAPNPINYQQAYAQNEMSHAPDVLHSNQSLGEIINNLKNNLDLYIESVALPGIYKFAQSMDYRWVIGVFIGLFILMVTMLSTIPMTATISHSIEAESMRRAVTIARGLAQVNRQAVIENLEVSVNIKTAEIEDGVSLAAVISAKDGHVIAPANLRQQDSDNTFFREARREGKEFHKSLGNSIIGASTPIFYYDPLRGEQTAIAFAIVLYDMSAVGVRTEQTFSLFVETLAIALVFGFFLYFLLIKVIEHPLTTLNNQLDEALREGRDDLKTDYKYPVLENLASNLNSALTRGANGGGEKPQVNLQQRHREASQLVSMIENACIAISAIDSKIIASNENFDRLIGSQTDITGSLLTELSDPALKQNMIRMIQNLRKNPDDISTSDIPFEGISHTVSGQTIFAFDEPVYFLITILKNPEEGT